MCKEGSKLLRQSTLQSKIFSCWLTLLNFCIDLSSQTILVVCYVHCANFLFVAHELNENSAL